MLVNVPTCPPLGTLLSPREQEIIRLVAEGCSDEIIAHRLGMSLWMLNTFLRRIFTKLGVNSRAKVVAYVYQRGEMLL
jgi:DNA-binding CsgD family transcriptional regulator